MTNGIIFNIQRSSLHDGPGIRTTIFTKGCSLRCFWCHNPEGLSTHQEVQYFQSRCIQCGECVRVCSSDAAKINDDGKISFVRALCQACGECVEVCPENARSLTGQKVTVEQVMSEVLQDRAFYDSSQGGVTFSGGEPMAQVDFLLEALQACKAAGIHTAIETAGNYAWSLLVPVLPWVDLVMMDLKIIDPLLHKQFTGVSNGRILEISRRLALTDKPLIFRTPVIPGVNDSIEAIDQIACHVKTLIEIRGAKNGRTPAPIEMELLTFHPLAADKYHSLDILNRTEGFKPPTKEHISRLESVIFERGIKLVPHN